jgi:hypothetical protein
MIDFLPATRSLLRLRGTHGKALCAPRLRQFNNSWRLPFAVIDFTARHRYR